MYRRDILFDGITGPSEFYRGDNFNVVITEKFKGKKLGGGEILIDGKYDNRCYTNLFYLPDQHLVLQVEESGLGTERDGRSRDTTTTITMRSYSSESDIKKFKILIETHKREHHESLEALVLC